MKEEIEKILAELPKERREKVMFAFDYSPEFLATPSIGLNMALGGGLPYGRMSTVWGTKSAGKSSLCLQIIAAAQQQGKTCLYMDVEGTYDDKWARRLGVDSENLLLDESRDVASASNSAKDYISAGVDVVVVDSVSALTPMAQIEDGVLKGFEENNAMAASAREVGKFLNMLNYVNDNTLIILIAHGSMGPAGAMWKFQLKGGNALQYYSSQVVKLISNNTSDLVIKNVNAGDKVLQHPGARKVKYKVDWNKVGPQGLEGEYIFHFVGDYVGIDTCQDLVKTAVEYGILKVSGSWITWGDEKVQGIDNLAERIRNNNEEYDKLREAVEDGRI